MTPNYGTYTECRKRVGHLSSLPTYGGLGLKKLTSHQNNKTLGGWDHLSIDIQRSAMIGQDGGSTSPGNFEALFRRTVPKCC